jgi:hypothetical protein
MGSGSVDIPPPPPGFKVVGGAAVPPPPPGFRMMEAPAAAVAAPMVQPVGGRSGQGRSAVDDAQQAELDAFEAANPTLRGKYSFSTMPQAGEVAGYQGGGGKSGGIPRQVQAHDPTFTKTGANLRTATAAGWKPAFEPYVDWGSAPMGANEGDQQVGTFDTGEPVYQTMTGVQYARPMVYPADWGGPGTEPKGDGKSLGTALKDMGKGIAQGIASGITAPGRALSGEVVTNNDVTSTASLALPSVRNPVTKVPVQTAKTAARDMGIQRSLGMRGKPAAMAASALEAFIPSAHVIANDAARTIGQIQKAFAGTAGKLGAALSPDAAGAQMQSGLRKFVDTFQRKASDLYDRVDELIPEDRQIAMSKTVDAISAAKKAFAANPAMAQKIGLNEWDQVAREAAKSGAPWQAAKQLRSEVGEAIGRQTGGPLADQGMGRLKRLYAALTEDMDAGAKAISPQAHSAWRRAGAYYKAGTERIENNLDGLIGKDVKSGPNAERAFEAFSAMAKTDRAASDVVRMRRIKSSMPEEDWGALSASFVDRLGKAKPAQQTATGDAFSPTTFLTNWVSLSPEAKRLLLPDGVRSELQKLAEVSGLVKAANAERNYSKTGTVGAGMALASAATVAPLQTALASGAVYLSAQAMTNPFFLKVLNAAARGTTAPLRVLAEGRGPQAKDAIAALAALNAGQSDQEQK